MTDYRYASGEEPHAGDIVRSLADKPAGPRKTGDVFTVQKISPYGNCVYYAPRTHGEPATFELIARAGEPVRYQPGDVVECVRGSVTGPGVPGDRYEIDRAHPYPDHVYLKGYASNVWAGRFKLVRRPAKTEPLVFTPPEPQVGDRVRVTFEADTVRVNGDLTALRLKGGSTTTAFSAREMAQATVEIIERAEKPLAVGDRVVSTAGRVVGEIRAVTIEHAWVQVSPRTLFTERLDKLRRLS